MNQYRFNSLFPHESDAIEYFLKIKYPNGLICPHCGSVKPHRKTSFPRVGQCNDCDNTFSVLTNTIFYRSRTPLHIWFNAVRMMLNARKGISAYQLQRELGVTYKCAWRMLRQIRVAMGNTTLQVFKDSVIEIDETYIGGTSRKDGKDIDTDGERRGPLKRGRGTDKTPVIGVLNRDTKQVYARVATMDEKGRKLSSKQLLNVLNISVSPADNNVIVSDEFRGYMPLKRSHYTHKVIDHTKGYSDGNGTHTNTIEGFWGILKRSIYGVYHNVESKYLQDYINECAFRYNNPDESAFDILLYQCCNKDIVKD